MEGAPKKVKVVLKSGNPTLAQSPPKLNKKIDTSNRKNKAMSTKGPQQVNIKSGLKKGIHTELDNTFEDEDDIEREGVPIVSSKDYKTVDN